MNEEIMRKAGMGRQVELVKVGKCPLCEKKVFKSELRNEIEVNEFNISGIGHCCQQYLFAEDGTVK